jgi:acyl carrier protein
MDNLLGQLRVLIVDTLDLADISPQDIDPDAPLFGGSGEGGLGLDSIDALELAVAISKKYGVSLKADDEVTTSAFRSLSALAAHIAAARADQGELLSTSE